MKKKLYLRIFLCLYLLIWGAFGSYAQVGYTPYTENEKDNALTVLYTPDASSVKKIILKKKNFTKFPPEIFRFKNLEELDLSGNQLTEIPEDIGKLTALRILRISVNSLTSLPKALQNLEKITYLDISYNQFEKFPYVITQLPNIETLNISGNQIPTISEDIGNLTQMRNLSCSINKLTKLPKNIGKLSNLTNLQAASNKISSLPTEIGNLSKLMYLTLYNNELTTLPSEMGKMKSLIIADISKNNLKEMPKEMKQMLALKTLYVKRKDTQIPTIPDELLTHIRDDQIKTDIGDIDFGRMLNDLNRREQDRQRLVESEKNNIKLQAERDKQKAELAEARAKESERQTEVANARAVAERERAALQQAEAESKRLQAEKDKEKAELEGKLAQEKASQESEAARKDKEAAAKESAAAKEIRTQQEKAKKADELARRQTERLNQTIIYAAIGALMFAFIFILYVLNSNRKVKQKQKEAELQRAKADKLLLNILPIQVADELKEKGVTEVRHFHNTSILFADVKGFSALASKVTPQELIKELDITFGKFDDVITQYGLERIKTIGDCYMCVGGVPNPDPANVVYMIAASLEIQNWMHDEYERRNGDFWQVRLGVHIGDLVAGVIGKTKFAYDVWGHAVNTASRMESGGEVSRVNISVDTYHHVKDFFVCTYRGQIEAKNIGLVDTYFVDNIKPELSVNGAGRMPNEEFVRRAKLLK